MWPLSALSFLVSLIVSAEALGLTPLAKQPTFVPASKGAVIASPSYGRASNGSLAVTPVVPGLVFDRFIQIWLENTNFEVAITSPVLQGLNAQGILLTNYHAVTHPSEPNYISASGGDFFGLADDNLHAIPANVSTIVDLLEQKKISWAAYQESMLGDGDPDFSETIPNYVTGTSSLHTFYVRKHNPFIIYDSIATVPARAALIRNFNDFAADFNASALPQYIFVTPNLDDDGHDTSQSWIDSWLNFWFMPLLNDPRFNSPRTLISLTYDEDGGSSPTNNRVFNVLLGGAVPTALHGTSDNTFYTHFSLLSTVERNWQLNCLGRQDTNTTLANVFAFVATATGFTNQVVTNQPPLDSSGTTPGPLNPSLPAPWPAPNLAAVCPGGGTVIP